MKVDFDHWQGSQIGDLEIEILNEQQAMQLISMLKPEFHMDGNMYCFSYPSRLGLPNDAIQGFGETAAKAALDFNTNFYHRKAHGNKASKP